MGLGWFRNLIWRLRSHGHFEALTWDKELGEDRLKEIVLSANKAVWNDPTVAPNAAAKQIDLLNNVDRFGGWDQMTALACICTEAQLEAYNKKKQGDDIVDRERLTRHLHSIPVAKEQRPWLDETNKRLVICRAHGSHFLDAPAVKSAVKMFRRYVHNTFL